jgi:hypothetical protein
MNFKILISFTSRIFNRRRKAFFLCTELLDLTIDFGTYFFNVLNIGLAFFLEGLTVVQTESTS